MNDPTHVSAHGRGQALVLLATLLAFLLVPLGLVVLAVNQERTAYAAINALVRTAATDGAGVLADPSVAAGVPVLAGSSASCIDRTGSSMSAAGRACQTLQTGLEHLFPGQNARVNVPAALAATQVSVLNGTPATPAQDPTTGQIYHYPTVCIASRLWVGVMEYDGAGVAFTFHACAQTVWRTASGSG
jgi:hypothetical protein